MAANILAKITGVLYRRKSRYIQVVDSKDCYLVRHDLPPGIKVDRKFIQLNYSSESPFAHYALVYLKKKEMLYIWFIRHEKSSAEKGRFLIPESLLLTAALGKPGKSVITVESSDNSTDIVAIKNGDIMAQYSRGKWFDPDDPHNIDSICREHGINTPEIIAINASSKAAGIEKGLGNLSVFDLRGMWLRGEQKGSNILAIAIRILPTVVVCVVLLTLIDIYATWSLEWKVGELDKKITVLKEEVSPILKVRQDHESLRKFWQVFVDNEVSPMSQVSVYFRVVEIVGEMGGQLTRWNGNKSSVLFGVEIPNAAALLDKVQRQDGFHSTKIDGSVRKNKKSQMEVANFSINLIVATK